MATLISRPMLLILAIILTSNQLLQHGRTDARIVIKATQADLDRVCRQSQDYDFCIGVLSYDPRTPAADLPGLASIAASLTVIQIQQTTDAFPDLEKRITDPVGKQRLGVCESDYSDALGKFHEATLSAEAKKYNDVINFVRDGTNKVIDCENIYRMKDPIATCPISADNHGVIKLSEIILIIVNELIGSH